MDENSENAMELEGEINFSAPTPPHEVANVDFGLFGTAAGIEQDTFPQNAFDNEDEASIDFSTTTVDSQENKDIRKEPLPSMDADGIPHHDSFEFTGLDLFGNEDEQPVSDVSSDDEHKSSERKQKKEKKIKEKKERKYKVPKENEEVVIKSTVHEEIEVRKNGIFTFYAFINIAM